MSDPGPWATPSAPEPPAAPDRLQIRGRIGGAAAAITVAHTTVELERPGQGLFSDKERCVYEVAAFRTFVVREEREHFRLVMAILFALVTLLVLVGGAGSQALIAAVPGLVFFASWRLRPKVLIDLRVADLEVVFVAHWSSRAAAHDAARRIGKLESPPPTAVPIVTYLGEQFGVLRASEAELRARYRAQAGSAASAAEEERYARMSKRLALWILGWMVALPAVLVSALSLNYLLTTPVGAGSVWVVAVGAPIGFYLLVVGCTILQSKLHGFARAWLEG